MLFDKAKNQWITWTESQTNFMVKKETKFNDLIIPTNDLIRNTYLLHLCVRNKLHLLVAGPTGTGKTINLVTEINKCYFNTEFTNLQIGFSGKT